MVTAPALGDAPIALKIVEFSLEQPRPRWSAFTHVNPFPDSVGVKSVVTVANPNTNARISLLAPGEMDAVVKLVALPVAAAPVRVFWVIAIRLSGHGRSHNETHRVSGIPHR